MGKDLLWSHEQVKNRIGNERKNIWFINGGRGDRVDIYRQVA